MKAKLEYDTDQINPAYNRREHQLRGRGYPVSMYVDAPAGTIVDAKDSYRLVQIGIASPADDECRERCGLSEDEIALRIRQYHKLHKGIWPEDYERFEAGEMDGYEKDAKGNIHEKPGPNADATDEYFEDEEFE